MNNARFSGVTLNDVARLVGVHPSTVSRALDPARSGLVKEETRRRVVEAAQRLGYRPDMIARSLQSGRTATVGVVVADLGNMFVTPIIHGIASALEVAGIMPVIAETQDDHVRFSAILDHLLSRRVDAIVTAAAREADQAILESAARIVPVVVTGRPLPGSSLPQVIHDDRKGGEMVARHFAELGHRRVCQLRGPLDVGNFAQRSEGFSRVCRELGLEEVVLDVTGDRPVIEEGERLMRALLDQVGGPDGLPTALFAQNDLMAAGALEVLNELGVAVPEHVSLVGYNDLPMVDLIDPPLTTVRYPSLEVGKAAGDLVVKLLEGERAENVCLEPVLVSRKSTAPPRSTQ
ncbi:MAG: LacI family transcriptional regulator [Acidimicrobiia bacterium]|nr:MAG: LacI family transcriptional regulator [Acidimicrobiia bacterium]